MKWLISLMLSALVGAMACSPGAASSGGQPLPTITVAAAADVQFAFEEIAPLFQKEKGVKVEFTFGSSGSLAQQVENGAPIDVFVSADEGYVTQLQTKGLILDDTRQIYAFGHLVLVTNRATGLDPKRLEDLLRPDLKHVAMANPDVAPYGRAARQALTRAGFWDQIRPKLVYGENIRQTLQFVQTGNAEAGIVARSIANVPEVTSISVEDSLYDPLQQGLAVIRGTPQEIASREFVAFVNGPQGRSIMKKYGFTLPGES
ncbi:MAG: molybdate ABC transporter substrate-binding protein [Dehalococcoidia bacterium]|nr:molybdate ABC transporter substrate-binding protein [Dehalococcoidia bacterium]